MQETSTPGAGVRPAAKKLILGLGNPGERYRETRHNLGFWVVEEVARRRRIPLALTECRSFCGWDAGVALALPQTYMNRSGYAARCFVERSSFAPENLLVVFDDIHLALGRLRLRRGGSPGGHRGMESIIENLQTNQVPRLRMGIAPEAADGLEIESGEDLPSFVLAPFDREEKERVDEMVARAADACETWLESGVEAAMNRFNG